MPPHRFLHAADLHLDSPFSGLSAQEPELAKRLRDASLEALDRLVDAAIESSCHFVVFAGDIYDGLERGVRAQLALQKAAERLDAAEIPLVMLHGNHDPLDLGYTAVRKWPASTTILSASEPQVVELETPAGRVTITGQSYPAKKVTHSLAAKYPEPADTGLHVAVLHTQLLQGGGTNPYSPCTLEDLERTGFHYWALGHIHERAIYDKRGPVVAYPGNLQGRHFRECGPRGALMVEGSPDYLKPTPLALAPVVFERVSLDVTGLEDLADVRAALPDAMPEHDRTTLLRAELTGRSPLFEALHEAETREKLLETLDQESGSYTEWMEVRSDVEPSLPWEKLRDQQSLAGALVRRKHEADEVRRLLDGARGLGRFVRTLDGEELETLCRRALYRAVDAIHRTEAS